MRPPKTALVSATVIAIAAVGLFVLIALRSGPFSGLEPFPVDYYRGSTRDLVENQYMLEGRIESVLGHREGKGRLIELRPLDAEVPLPVLVPPTITINLLRGQLYRMHVEILPDGVVFVHRMDKV